MPTLGADILQQNQAFVQAQLQGDGDFAADLSTAQRVESRRLE